MIALLELTTTSGEETAVTELAQRARAATTAAVCVPAGLVARAAAELEDSGIRVATVVAEDDPDWAARAAEAATDEGADEVDLLVDPSADLDELVAACRGEVGTLKVVLAGQDPHGLESAAIAALAAGADFVGGPFAAASLLLRASASVGFGGVKLTGLTQAAEVAAAVALADELLGAGWAKPQTLRLGAPGVLG